MEVRKDLRKDPLSLLQTIHFSTSEVEGDSEGEIEFTVELNEPRIGDRNGENKPLMRNSRKGALSNVPVLSSEEDDCKK